MCPTLAAIYAGDAVLLERLSPRKELRRTRDLVRLSSERIDDRALALETAWFGTDAANDGSDSNVEDEEDDAEASGSGMDEEEDADEAGLVESAECHGLEGSVSGDEDKDDDDEDDDGSNGSDDDSENVGMDEEDEGVDEDEVPPTAHSSSARKRKPPSLPRSDPVRPSKKVAFTGITSQTKRQVPLSNKRTDPRLAHRKRQKPDTASLPDPSATTSTSKKANLGVRSTRAPAGSARTRAHKPAANAPTTTAQKHATGEDGAYDFSQFF